MGFFFNLQNPLPSTTISLNLFPNALVTFVTLSILNHLATQAMYFGPLLMKFSHTHTQEYSGYTQETHIIPQLKKMLFYSLEINSNTMTLVFPSNNYFIIVQLFIIDYCHFRSIISSFIMPCTRDLLNPIECCALWHSSFNLELTHCNTLL